MKKHEIVHQVICEECGRYESECNCNEKITTNMECPYKVEDPRRKYWLEGYRALEDEYRKQVDDLTRKLIAKLQEIRKGEIEPSRN